ncbi:alpha/beta hydrolase [Christensenellaceae bacterium OttesenSCG-928-L17]|nr:alpha/beta hydrolase [Christensenellaceae bacterium OttesenSCG-928-L17]
MFYGAKNGALRLSNADMHYASFGSGPETLVMIPGVGDGLKTVKGLAVPMAMLYRQFAQHYKVYVFSRKSPLNEGTTTRDMAKDLYDAMAALEIPRAHVVGISQGGMIAQHLAIDYPAVVKKLVLAVTLSRQNDVLQTVLHDWMEMANAGDYKRLFIDTTEKAYTEQTLKKYRPFYPVLSRASKPKDFGRFLIQAQSCLTHDTYDALNKITCPTLIIGAGCDQVVGKDAAEEMAERIRGSKRIVYEELGHGAYTEAKDFNTQILNFLRAGA